MAERGLTDEERELFLGMLGHDMRQPLMLIKMSVDLALKFKELPSEVIRYLDRIGETASRLGRMAEDLLDFSRIRHYTEIPLKLETCHLNPVIFQILEDLATQFPEVRVEMKLDGDGRGAWDRNRLAQILTNLLHNAIKHGKQHAPLKIHSYTLDDNQQCVEIFNEGEKIEHDKLEQIFKPYQAGNQGGIGLGLYITKYLVEAHGGTIKVMSEDSGTTFTVCLPIQPKSGGGKS